MRLTHEIPVTLPAKAYLDYWKPSPYHAVGDDFLGMWLINSLTRKTTQVKECSLTEMKKKGYGEVWKFTASSRGYGILMPRRRAYEFNALIRQMMYLELVSDIEALRREGGESYIQQALDEFRDRYGLLEKDFPDERLRKMYQRFRERELSVRSEYRNISSGMLFGNLMMKGTRIDTKL